MGINSCISSMRRCISSPSLRMLRSSSWLKSGASCLHKMIWLKTLPRFEGPVRFSIHNKQTISTTRIQYLQKNLRKENAQESKKPKQYRTRRTHRTRWWSRIRPGIFPNQESHKLIILKRWRWNSGVASSTISPRESQTLQENSSSIQTDHGIRTSKQTNKQTNKQINKQTNKQTKVLAVLLVPPKIQQKQQLPLIYRVV